MSPDEFNIRAVYPLVSKINSGELSAHLAVMDFSFYNLNDFRMEIRRVLTNVVLNSKLTNPLHLDAIKLLTPALIMAIEIEVCLHGAQNDPVQSSLIVEARKNKIEQVLAVKGKEYARDLEGTGEVDRLINFKRATEESMIIGYSEEQICLNYADKHIVSLHDLIYERMKLGKELDKNLIDEKVGDICNYIVLMAAIYINKN